MESPQMQEQFETAGIPLTPLDAAGTTENYANFWDELEAFLQETGRID
jgi:hypothetical protein